MTIHDFHSILGLFNQAARMRPPPRTKIVWLFILSVIWIGSSLFFYTLWHFYVESIFLLLLLPAFLVSSLFLLAFRHRSIRKKVSFIFGVKKSKIIIIKVMYFTSLKKIFSIYAVVLMQLKIFAVFIFASLRMVRMLVDKWRYLDLQPQQLM